ncbi:MAG TPA: hypothetical protein VL125_16735 [Pelobium sp.]|nr:hypothetical protein [Pelobium sp.]
MKSLITFIMLIMTELVYAQQKTDSLSLRTPGVISGGTAIRICAPSRASLIQKPPLYIIKYGKKEYRSNKSSDHFNQFSPKDIASVNIFKDSTALAKYGDDAEYGAVIITIKDDKVSEFNKNFRKYKRKNKD